MHRLLRETISRGKRQRIKKRLAVLNGTSEVAEAENPIKVVLNKSAPAKVAEKKPDPKPQP